MAMSWLLSPSSARKIAPRLIQKASTVPLSRGRTVGVAPGEFFGHGFGPAAASYTTARPKVSPARQARVTGHARARASMSINAIGATPLRCCSATLTSSHPGVFPWSQRAVHHHGLVDQRDAELLAHPVAHLAGQGQQVGGGAGAVGVRQRERVLGGDA